MVARQRRAGEDGYHAGCGGDAWLQLAVHGALAVTARRDRRVTPYTVTREQLEELRADPPPGSSAVAWACAVALGEHDAPVTEPCLVGCVQRCCDVINRATGGGS